MNKNILTILLIGIFMISFASSLEYSFKFKQNSPAIISVPCTDSSIIPCASNVRCNVTIDYANGTTLVDNRVMTLHNSGNYRYNLSSTDTSILGDYLCFVNCIGSLESGFGRFAYRVTPTGEEKQLPVTITYIFLILFFSGLAFSFYSISKKTDYDNWYRGIVKNYEDKNKIKVLLSGICYMFVKETFITYYLICFPVMILFKEIIEIFGVVSILGIMDALLVLYLVGLVIVGLIFFGKIQEFVMNIIEDLKNRQWGIER